MADKTIGQLTLGTLNSGDYIPSERNSLNYRLNLKDTISGAFINMPLTAQSATITATLQVEGSVLSYGDITSYSTLSTIEGINLGLNPVRVILSDTGPPNGSYPAPTGSLFMSRNGTPNYTLYVKETGVSSHGWNPVLTNLVTGENLSVGLSSTSPFFISSPSSGTNNIFLGSYAASSLLAGNGNVVVGSSCLSETYTCDGVVILGRNAAYINSVGDYSILIGEESRVASNNDTNSIVIGAFAEGYGSNTVSIGSSAITHTYLKGIVTASSLSGVSNFYATDSSAAAAISNSTIGFARSRFINITDDFITTSAASTIIGALGWAGAATATLVGSTSGHPGIFRISSTAAAAAYIYLTYNGSDSSYYNGLTSEYVIRLEGTASGQCAVGIIGAGGTPFAYGARCLYYDPTLSANWRVLHATNAGGASYVDTTKAAVAGDWVRFSLTFSGDNTICKIATTSSPTETTVVGTGAWNPHNTYQTPQFYIKGTNAALNRYVDIDYFGLFGESITSRL